MKSINITVTGSIATVTEPGIAVSGTVGLPVTFTFDSAWDGLRKTAVFRANGITMDCVDIHDSTVVPWELLKNSGCRLWAGVYGTNADGSIQIPTVWADLGVIQPGADPSGDESADPTLPVWEQVYGQIEKMESISNRVTTIDETSDDNHYPTAKAVYNHFAKAPAAAPFLIVEVHGEKQQVASHSSDEIREFMEAGGTVLLSFGGGMMFTCEAVTGFDAYFSYSFFIGEEIMPGCIKVDSEKNVTRESPFEMLVEAFSEEIANVYKEINSIKENVGSIETALDGIIAIQEALIGGNG